MAVAVEISVTNAGRILICGIEAGPHSNISESNSFALRVEVDEETVGSPRTISNVDVIISVCIRGKGKDTLEDDPLILDNAEKLNRPTSIEVSYRNSRLAVNAPRKKWGLVSWVWRLQRLLKDFFPFLNGMGWHARISYSGTSWISGYVDETRSRHPSSEQEAMEDEEECKRCARCHYCRIELRTALMQSGRWRNFSRALRRQVRAICRLQWEELQSA